MTKTIEITERQAEILLDLRQTCLDHAGIAMGTNIWDVYARTLGEILNSKERESNQ